MPIDLPDSKRKQPHQTKTVTAPKHPVLSKMLNILMVGSVLFLFAIVLLQEKRYADGDAGTVADAFILKVQTAIADNGDTVAPN